MTKIGRVAPVCMLRGSACTCIVIIAGGWGGGGGWGAMYGYWRPGSQGQQWSI